jgi:hypothetical protein
MNYLVALLVGGMELKYFPHLSFHWIDVDYSHARKQKKKKKERNLGCHLIVLLERIARSARPKRIKAKINAELHVQRPSFRYIIFKLRVHKTSPIDLAHNPAYGRCPRVSNPCQSFLSRYHPADGVLHTKFERRDKE